MDETNYESVIPFWIDVDAYSDRDRLMFTCGAEYWRVWQLLILGFVGDKMIHRENESRVRMMCGQLGVKCDITSDEGYDGCECWSTLTIKENKRWQPE